jgi:uncharacterized protein YabE (DUF348 family)
VFAVSSDQAQGERLLVIHDGTTEHGILTDASTIREAFKSADIPVDTNDLVEPGLDEPLVASSYDVNVYRARPVTIVDGAIRKKIMSAYRTPKQIAAHAGMELRDEDVATTSLSANFVASGGAVLQLTIDRATPFTFVLYGKKTTAYTQAKTVAEMLKDKKIILGENDVLSVDENARLVADMTIELWRNGKQTITEESDIPFDIEKVQDGDRPVGYREVKTPGEPGKRTVTYEIEMKNGVEVSRKEINSVTTKQPVSQIETVGVKPNGSGLTKAKGVMNYTDSKGVTHRETYYDLPMRVVMGNCGAGGFYSVREDGAKVDRDGYVIVAANLGNYPRCSVVETSLGLGKVYDTGGFAQHHPHGFDLATDWTNYDGV